MSDPREELREAIARAILTPDESYYSDESLFDTDWFERELALHRADCVLRTIEVNKDLVLAVMEGKPEWNDLDAFRQACIEVLGEDPFAPEDGERTTCPTCDDSGMVSISGRPEDGPDPCPDCWPEDGER